MGKNEEALLYYDQALDIDNNLVIAYINRGAIKY